MTTWADGTSTARTAAALEDSVRDYTDARVPFLDVTDVTADAQYVATGSINSGSATLTATGAGFTSADVGKVIAVGGAGAAGVTLCTTIAGYTSSTVVTLTASAGTSVTGAKVRWGTDNSMALQAALTAAASTGGHLRLPTGGICVASTLTPIDNLVVSGSGPGATNVYVMSRGSGFMARSHSGDPDRGFFVAHEFTVHGLWDFEESAGTNADRLFSVTGYREYRMSLVAVKNGREMSVRLSGGPGSRAIIMGCLAENSAKDAFNVTDCGSSAVIGNIVRHCGDDAIAVHTNPGYGDPTIEGHVISGNIIEDSQGIKCLGAVKTAVTGNTLKRMHGYAVYLGVDTGSAEGYNDVTDVEVSGNVVSDVLNLNLYGGGSFQRVIYVKNADTGFVRPVQGAATPTITDPRDVSPVSSAALAQNAGAQRIRIHNNIVAQTLPATANYSDWGFGETFNYDGWSDPALTTYTNQATGVYLQNAHLSVSVRHNRFEGMGRPIDTDAAGHLEELWVEGNEFVRYADHGVYIAVNDNEHGRFHIRGNYFDADPLFEHSNRAAGGKWTSATGGPNAVRVASTAGVVVDGNVVRNCAAVCYVTGSAAKPMVTRNTIYGEFDSSATLGADDADNRGVRDLTYCGNDSRFVWEASDPTSATYGTILYSQLNDSSAAMPAAGYWLTGQTVFSTGVTESGSAASKYTIIGWRRLTTGSANVLNTDWRELRGLTGN